MSNTRPKKDTNILVVGIINTEYCIAVSNYALLRHIDNLLVPTYSVGQVDLCLLHELLLHVIKTSLLTEDNNFKHDDN